MIWKKRPIENEIATLNSNISIQPLTSSEGIKTVALDNTRCPANQVRWFNCRLSIVSELPSSAHVTSIARVTKRIDNTCFIELFTDGGETWTNAYNGSSWSGWEQLALNSKMTGKTYDVNGTTSEYGEVITNLAMSNVNAIKSLRITYSGNLAHCYTSVTATGYIIIIVTDRNGAKLANTQVTGTIYYI